MAPLFEVILYVLALTLLSYSFFRDRKKTKMALIKSWKAFINILPALSGVLALIGLMLAVISPDLITKVLGQNTGIWGMFLTSLFGAITLIPAFVAYPMAASLLESGAGIMQIAVFVSTLTMVGTVTAPLEAKYFGWKETILRNGFAYIFSFAAAAIIGAVLK
ncbi:MAG: permease [Dethiobacteria bacterium]|nr:permease [Dethiobacteria bacterium]